VLALFACACAAPARAADVVRFGVDANTLGAQVWVAVDRGDFRRYGIDPQVVVFPLGVDAIDAVLTGRVDLATALDFAAATRLPSNQMRIVSAIMRPNPGFHKLAVIAAIRRRSDLIGKRIGVVRATAQSFVTIQYLARNGIPADRVTILSFQDLFDEVAAMRAGRIDAAFVWANGVAQATLIPGVHILEDDSSSGVHFFGYLVTGARYERGHAAQIEACLRALTDATAFMQAHPRQAAEIVAAHTGAEVDTIDEIMRASHYIIGLSPRNRTTFIAMTAFATINDPMHVPLDPAGAFDDAFLHAAEPRLDALHR